MKTKEAARGRWRAILPHLGINPKYLKGRHMPCPACGGTDRFRFDDKNRDGGYICGQCGAGDGFSLLMKVHGWNFATTARRVDEVVGNKSSKPMAGAPPPPPPEWEPVKSVRDATLWLRRYQRSKLKDWLAQHGSRLTDWINRERPWGYYPEEKKVAGVQHIQAAGAQVEWGSPKKLSKEVAPWE